MIAAAAFAVYVGMWASALVVPPATLLAWWLARRRLPVLLEAAFWLPALVPPGALHVAGTDPHVLTGALLAFPLALLAARAAFERVGPRWGRLAQSLGDSRWHTFGRVDLPLAFPGVLAAGVLAFARAATIEVAGLPAAVPALLLYAVLVRAHHAALADAGA